MLPGSQETSTIELLDSTGTSIGTTGILSPSQWYRIELKVGVGTSAPYELRINGSTQLSGTANLSSDTTSAVRLGNTTSVLSNAAQIGVLNNGGSTLEKRTTLMALMVAVSTGP